MIDSAIHLEPWAAAVVQSTGVATNAKGCVTSRDGGNVFSVTLDKPLPAAQCIADVTVIGGDGTGCLFHMVNHASDTVKEIRFFFTSAGAAQATSFMVAFKQLSPL